MGCRRSPAGPGGLQAYGLGARPVNLTEMICMPIFISVKSIVFLCLACLVLQSTPLRACAWEEMALGSNCHDRSQDSVRSDAERVAMDGCVSHPVEESHQCVCERPRASIDRFGVVLMGVDMLPAIYHAPVLRVEPVEYCLNFAGQMLQEPCPPARILPLLN